MGLELDTASPQLNEQNRIDRVNPPDNSVVLKVTATLDATEAVRIFDNAVAFIPLRDKKAAARIVIDHDSIGCTGTDTYTIGSDAAEAVCDGAVTCHVDREGLQALAKAARTAKRASVTVSVHTDDAVTISDGSGVVETVKIVDGDERLWAAVDALMARLDESEYQLPASAIFDPAKLARFAKVKASKDAAAEFLFQGAEEPALIRIGVSFRGAIMPIVRDVYEEFRGSA